MTSKNNSDIKFFICYAGQSVDQYTFEHWDAYGEIEVGVIGMIYSWNGEWIRSPEEVGNRDSTTEMRLISIGTGRVCSGTEGCFMEVPTSEELLDWYIQSFHP